MEGHSEMPTGKLVVRAIDNGHLGSWKQELGGGFKCKQLIRQLLGTTSGGLWGAEAEKGRRPLNTVLFSLCAITMCNTARTLTDAW